MYIEMREYCERPMSHAVSITGKIRVREYVTAVIVLRENGEENLANVGVVRP